MANPLGSAPSVILGVGLGAAASTAIEPIVEPARQEAWKNNPNRILNPERYAALVAQGAVDLGFGAELAQREGLAADKFRSLVYLAQRAPTYGEAQDLRRRGKITDAQLRHSFAKAQIEAQYWDALADLVDDRLSPQVMALAMVRGLVDDDGILPVGPPTTVGKVPAFPVFDIDPVTEAAASGISKERLSILAGIAGRPPGPELMASATFREIIERADFDRAISEGDVRNEWRDAIFEVSRQILTSNQYAELQLRGYLTEAQRSKLTAQHGMSQADSDLLYNLLGRSIPVHQITTGLARGGEFEGRTDTIPKAYLQSLQRGNLRPEYYSLAYANRYSLPSAFVLRALLQDGAITQEEGEEYFLQLGWPPDLAKSTAKAYAPTATGQALNPRVKSEQSRFMTAAHTAYVKNGVTRDVIEPLMEPLVPDLADRDAIFQLWSNERVIDGLEPSPAAAGA